MLESGNYSSYLPAYFENDYFIRVICSEGLEFKIAEHLATSFMFELCSTLDLKLEFSQGRPDANLSDSDLVDPDYDSKKLSTSQLGIFPLIYGRGIKEVLDIYNSAKTTYNVDYKILSLTKIIEYIAPTIANEELYNLVSLKLTSPNIFNPTWNFINELGDIYKKHQSNINKDSELIKLTILAVLDFNDVFEYLPDYIKPKKNDDKQNLRKVYVSSNMEKLAEAIYDTRNEIAHAKANYKRKGLECPDEDKNQFVRLLDLIAVKCIRWFSKQAEEKRVVL